MHPWQVKEKLVQNKDIDGLIRLLKNEDSNMWSEAALGIGAIGDARAVEALTQALNDEDDSVRVRAAEALGMLGQLHHLESPLRDRQERVRFWAAESLVNVGGIEAVPALVRALKDDREEVYNCAAWALGYRLNDRRKRMDHTDEGRLREALVPAVQYLISMLERAEASRGAQTFDEYINRAIGALGTIGDTSAIPVLEKLLAKVRQKVKEEGVVRQYVDTGIAAGYISTEDDIGCIENAIWRIKKREKKRWDKRATNGV